MSRYLEAIYCEDIRHEVSGTLSLMGVTYEALTFSEPTVLPEYFISTTVVSDLDDPVESLRILIKQNGKSIAEQQIPTESISQKSGLINARWQRITNNFRFYQLEVKEDGIITVVAQTERETLMTPPLRLFITPKPRVVVK